MGMTLQKRGANDARSAPKRGSLRATEPGGTCLIFFSPMLPTPFFFVGFFFFFFDFTYIPEHVTKTKAGRPWPIHESGDFLNYGCSSHACGAVTPLIRSQVPYERRQAGLQLVDVAPGQRGQGHKVHHVILSSQYHPSEWGSKRGMPGSQGLLSSSGFQNPCSFLFSRLPHLKFTKPD